MHWFSTLSMFEDLYLLHLPGNLVRLFSQCYVQNKSFSEIPQSNLAEENWNEPPSVFTRKLQNAQISVIKTDCDVNLTLLFSWNKRVVCSSWEEKKFCCKYEVGISAFGSDIFLTVSISYTSS